MRSYVTIVAAAAATTAMLAGVALADDPASRADGGRQVYERANCVGCHKWSGVGGGGYGGAALSLRATQLSQAQIIEIVTCGRPGTGMPHFTADPYGSGGCYGLSAADAKDVMPPAANVVLHPPEIEAVARYVAAAIQGRGDPTLAECVAFFGDGSRVCDTYQPKTDAAPRHAMPTPSTTSR